MTGDRAARPLLVDASVWITLAEVGRLDLLRTVEGHVAMPEAVVAEVSDGPAGTAIEDATGEWVEPLAVDAASDDSTPSLETAASHLGAGEEPDEWGGDVPLLAAAIASADAVVVTDDKPLRKTCKALSIPVSGSIGVLIRGVERGALDADEAKATLYAMDEVGARLSASLVRRAERLIERAAAAE